MKIKWVRLLALVLASIWLVGPAGLSEAAELSAWLDMPGWDELIEAQEAEEAEVEDVGAFELSGLILEGGDEALDAPVEADDGEADAPDDGEEPGADADAESADGDGLAEADLEEGDGPEAAVDPEADPEEAIEAEDDVPLDAPDDGAEAEPEALDDAAEAVQPGIALNAETLELGAGETFILTVMWIGMDEAPVTFESSDPTVASVAANGKVTAKKPGAVTITATCGDAEATCEITVLKAPSKVTLDQKALTLGVGDSYKLTATLPDGTASVITWNSSKPSVASVDPETGVVVAHAKGTATIAAKTYNGKKATCQVTVKVAPTVIAVSPAEMTLSVGQSRPLTVSLGKDSAGTWTLESDAPDVASIDGSHITAHAPGTAIVTAQAYNGVTASTVVTVVNAPEWISFDATEATLGEGEKLTLNPAIDGDAPADITYSSDDAKIAVVSANGVVTAKKAGRTTVRVMTHNGREASIEIAVVKAPSKVTLDQKALTLGVGDSYKLTATLPDGTASVITWNSSKPSVASVDPETGLVVAHAKGTATIAAKTYNGKKATCQVTVKVAPTAIAVSPAEMMLSVGQSRPLTVSLGKDSAGTWTLESDAPDVASVDGSHITAHAPGTAIVTAQAYNGVTASTVVTVVNAPEWISFDATEATLGEGEKLTLNPAIDGDAPTDITYSTDDAKIAVVSATGVVTAKKAGRTTVRVMTHNGREASIEIAVVKAPSKVTLDQKALTLGVGDSYKLTATLPDGTASVVTWNSSKSSVASVDPETGLVVAHAKGTATIAAKTYNGKKATCQVTVKVAPTAITVSPAELTLSVGQSRPLTVSLGKDSAGTWTLESDAPDVASIDGSQVTAHAPGTAIITAQAYNGVTASTVVTVVNAPEWISFDATEATLGEGEKLTLNPAIDGDAPTDITYSTDDAKIAVVSATGVVTAKKAGRTTVRVTTHNGREAVIEIAVVKAPSKITLDQKALTLGVGDSHRLYATLPDGTASVITWNSSKPSVASVDPETGVVVAHAKGTATIAAKTYNGKKATCQVTVKGAPTAIAVSPAEMTLSVGQSRPLTVSLGKDSAGTWTLESDAPDVASVDGSHITAHAPGTAIVTAQAYNGVTASTVVTVVAAPEWISFDATEATLGEGEKLTLNPAIDGDAPTDITYSTDDAKIAVVSATGVVTAKKAGRTTVRVITHNGREASIEIAVVKAPSKVTLDQKSLTLGMGDSYKLTATLPDGTASVVTWNSSKSSVASVDPDTGVVVAHGKGTATIAAKTYNGKKATCQVTVKAAPDSLVLKPGSYTLAVGQTAKVEAVLNSGSAASIFFDVADEGIAAMDGTTLTAKSVGSTLLMATAYNGVSDSAEITVVPAPGHVSLNAAEAVLGVGEKLALSPEIDAGSQTAFTWTTQSAKVATVSADGLVVGKNPGATVITVTTHNGKSAACAVTVRKAPGSVTLSSKALVLEIGDEWTLSATLPAGTASKLTFTSSNPEVASVDGEGRILGLKKGSAVITVKTFNGKSAKCTVAVSAPKHAPECPGDISAEAMGATSVRVGWSHARQAEGYRVYLGTRPGAANAELYGEYSARTDGVTLRGLSAGTPYYVFVTAFNEAGESPVDAGTFGPLILSDAAGAGTGRVALDCGGVILMSKGGARVLSASVTPSGQAGALSWETTTENIVSISPSGASCVIRAKQAGSATVSAELPDGASAAVTVIVVDTASYSDEKLMEVQKAVSRHEELLEESRGSDVLWTLLSGKLKQSNVLDACSDAIISRLKAADVDERLMYVYSLGTYEIRGEATKDKNGAAVAGSFYTNAGNVLYLMPFGKSGLTVDEYCYVFFHESGHAIDYNDGATRGFTSLNADSNEAVLEDVRSVLSERVDELIVSMGYDPENVSREAIMDVVMDYRVLKNPAIVTDRLNADEVRVYRTLRTTMYSEINELPMNNGMMVADAVEGATNYAVRGKFGHYYMFNNEKYRTIAETYFYDKYGNAKVALEPWAEYVSSKLMQDEEVIRVNETYLPRTSRYFAETTVPNMIEYFKGLLASR